MNDAAPLLRLEQGYKRYGDAEVLRGVDLDVAEGDVVCLIGASGCGKSTLLKCSNLIEPISGGRILLEGEEITSERTDPDRVRRHMTVIATHEMGFARQIADRVCFLSEGVILEQGPPEEIFGVPRQERTTAFLKRIVEAGRAADLEARP